MPLADLDKKSAYIRIQKKMIFGFGSGLKSDTLQNLLFMGI